MKINYISYNFGTDECRMMVRLLKRHINELEKQHQGPIGCQFGPAEEYEWSMATDMYNDLLKAL